MSFPKDFIWGVSAASYQIEGAAYEDGKGLSVWDVFCKRPGAVFHGHSGDVACDHYHRFRDDIALMKELGVSAYRLSLSWPRLMPDGVGALNPKGVAFYNNVIDGLLAAGIQPWITLFHWDYPYELYCRGGWLNPDSPHWFAEYAAAAARLFGDRVAGWVTHNEPQCFIGLGHHTGTHAPGLQLPLQEVLQAGHHALLAHGRAVQALRAGVPRATRVGIAPAGMARIPLTHAPADIAAARTLFHGTTRHDCFGNAWWLDPVFLGRYPEDGLALYGADAPRVAPGDMDIIRQPLDFCGINIYCSKLVRAGADGTPEIVPPPPGYNRTAQTDWHVTPETIYWIPKWLHERYRVPIVITENGHQNLDAIALDDRVHDPQRIDYLHRYLRCLCQAIAEGTPVQGYFHWTLLDNFEWALGYNVRVGLVHTDFITQARTRKDSFFWYKDVIAGNGAML